MTSAIAANAFADTAEANGKLAASRTVSPSTIVPSNSTALAVTETHELTSVDDDDRAKLTTEEFADIIGRSRGSKSLRGLMNKFLKPILEGRKTPKAVYGNLKFSDPMRNLLSEKDWIKWAFFVCQVGHQFEENGYEFLMMAMSTIYDAETLSNILITAVKSKHTRQLAINLAKVSNDLIKRRLVKRFVKLASELSHPETHTAETIQQTSRGRIFAYLEKHVRKKNLLPKKEFSFLMSYLSVLLDKNSAVGTTLSVSHTVSEDAALLEKLLSLSNFHKQECLDSLVSVWLDAKRTPSKIVSMLVQDKAAADRLTILFSNGPSRDFWLHYRDKYNAMSQDDEFTRLANLDFEQLMQMLFAVSKQKSPQIEKSMAYTTILKILISPSTAHLKSSHKHVLKLVSILLSDRTLPSDVLSMLTRGEADADKFNILFENEASRSFWVHYLITYYIKIKDVKDFTRTANTDLRQVMIMLREVRVPESSMADENLAKSTILRMLLSPAVTNVISSRKYLDEMTSNWLEQRLLPSAVVFMLVHEVTEANYFEVLFTYEPSSKFWMDYTKAYYTNTPSPKNPILSTLTSVFGDTKLKEILKKALTDEATREQAISLLNQLD